MGISWSGSSRRRHNAYYQNPPPHAPPPPPPPPPPYYYSTQPLALPLPPPPPPPPPPPHQPYFTTATSRTNPPPSYHPPHNPYQTHAPPTPPIHQPHYCSQYPYYTSCSYAHHHQMMGGFPYHHRRRPFYYGNQAANGWPAIRGPDVGPAQPIHPAPYVEHQNAKKVRNDVNVHKDTLRVEIDELNPDNHLVSFVFDALFDGSITIFYFAKEESNCRFVPLFPEAHSPIKIPIQKGLGQNFCQPSGTGIDLGFFELDDLSRPSPGEDVFPLVIVAETCLSFDLGDEHVGASMSNTSGHMQITQAVLEKKDGDPFSVRVIRQILWIGGVRYELREIYGIGSSAADGFSDNDPGKECVICMTEPKDTAVLPCRHMCMCSECAKALRLQSNKCPICRQPIEELIEIKVNNGD
uniref:RING-type E3 ubiquitin transferase n=1 Tax=Rhizophora mucronata TaxID=61149 RepID=A0A2P2J815_RHIMU